MLHEMLLKGKILARVKVKKRIFKKDEISEIFLNPLYLDEK